MLTALNLELPVVWDSWAAERARVPGTVWVPVAVRGLAPALVGAAPSSWIVSNARSTPCMA